MKFLDIRDTDEHIGPGYHYLYKWIKPYVKNKRILDIGCWNATLERFLEKDKCHVTGIDNEEEPLEYDRTRFPRFDFIKAQVEQKLPFKNNTFDIVLFFMVIEHIPKNTEQQALNNINKVTKLGGNLFMNTMLYNLPSNLMDPAYFPKQHRHYTKKQLEDFLTKAGFQIQETYYNGGFFTFFYISTLYFFKHVLKRKEPNGKLMDKLVSLDYRNRGFCEIEIRAVKIKNI